MSKRVTSETSPASTEYKPAFFRNRKIFFLTLKAIIAAISDISGNPVKKIKFLSASNIFSTMRLRKKLLLYKLVRFNDQYYSTPTIPAFPSAAYDNMVSKGGLNFESAGTELKKQIDSVFLAITSRCSLSCKYCYERYNINKTGEITADTWINTIMDLQTVGVNIFILSGGEPLNDFDKLIKILNSSDKNLSDFHIHTSGNTITFQKVKQLKLSGIKAAAVGLDDYYEAGHDNIRGKGSFKEAVKALRLFNDAGVLTYVNFCVRKEMLTDNRLFKYYDFVKSLNVSMIQLLEPRPCGGYFNNGSDVLLSETDRVKLTEFTMMGNKDRSYRNHPLIYYVAHIEGKNQLGCHMGGLSHFYIDSRGNVCPCVFFPVKYGNIREDNILAIYKGMRQNIPAPLHTECPSLLLSPKCREIYQDRKEFPVPFELIQRNINTLYKESEDLSGSPDASNNYLELKGEGNEKADIY